MNQRPESRVLTNQSVAIALFGNPDLQRSARIRNISGKGIGLELDEPVPPGSILKVDLEDGLLLGEVIYCRSEGGSYYAGVVLEHALSGLAELSRMVTAFQSAIAPAESGLQAAHSAIDGHHESE
jgi:hypothetical protein